LAAPTVEGGGIEGQTDMRITNSQAQAFYMSEPFQYLVQLKYLQHYPDRVACHEVVEGDSRAMLMTCLVADMPWDSKQYPEGNSMFLPYTPDARCGHLLASYIHAQWDMSVPHVFKFCDTGTRLVFRYHFRLAPLRSYYSFTTENAARAYRRSDRVVVSESVNGELVELFGRNGYSPDELDEMATAGLLTFALYEANKIVCGCLAFRNFQTIWEIGGVHTVESERRKGLAREVVQTALHVLRMRDLIPRYHVEVGNIASVRLAQSLDLTLSLQFEHYLSTAADD
jgi:ribosomal protein S18 acetylase RimI-like enzyme